MNYEMTEPLIYTTKGNVPVSSLEYRTSWVVADEFIKFTEQYTLAGEVVKESAHVYDKRGTFAAGEAQPF